MKTSRRGGLGRGLGALIQSTAEVDTEPIDAAEQPAPEADAEAKPRGRTKAPRAADAAMPSAENAAPDTTAKTSKGTVGQRPVDVFFSSTTVAEQGELAGTQDADAADTTDAVDDSAAAGTRRPARQSSRPTMPTVKAPSKARKTASKPSTAKSATPSPDTSADGSASESSTVSASIAVLREIPVGEIHPNPRQPREVFDEEHMQELVASIGEVGVLQPVVVREVAGPTPYELIMGERRWRATQLAGLKTIPAIVRHTADQDLLRDALLENLHRSQLNPLEEAAAYQQLMEDFACTQEELSQRIGRSRPQISNTMRLLRLPPLVQRRLAAGTLSAGHARALLGLTDPAEMERLAQRIVAEGLSVRATEDAVTQLQGTVRQAPSSHRPRSEPVHHERLDYFATALTSRLDTNVKITLGARKGRIAIDFASVEDLNRIMDVIQGEISR